jgi:hypothetical protein
MSARSYPAAVAAHAGAVTVTMTIALGLILLPLALSPAASASATPTSSASATSTASPSATSTASATPSPSVSPSSTPSPTKSPKPRPFTAPRTPAGGVRVEGGPMWDPATNKKFGHPSYVTVSSVSSLTNQVVQVSWYGFTPSSQLAYSASGSDYPVMVAQCKGLHPTSWSQCFGASNGGIQGQFSSNGPMNTAYATTNASGEGSTPIQLLTAQENSFLGCDEHSPCSLVIVPAQGGNIFTFPVNCGDHSQDAGLTDTGTFAFNSSYGKCSWERRFIVPLHFAQTPTDCPVKNPDFSAIGSPMLARAMNSWQSALCADSDPVNIQYDDSQAEPLAREDFLSGLDDVALTTEPASSSSGKHPFTYAPVAISAESIVFWIDNPVTDKPLTHLKLDPRLVLKLLTQSYDFEGEACSGGAIVRNGLCDNAVDGNPRSLFADPEFTRLNPHVAEVGDGYQVPTVMSGETDMTWELTRWIAANKDAKAFAGGTFDPWGEHVNTDYLNMQLPSQSLTAMDSFAPIAHRYDPVFPLATVAQYQVDNWYPATQYQPDPDGNYDKLTPEVPGQRALFAILDQADAAAYQLPTASLENAAGKYVAPANASMTAAVGTMKTSAANHITEDTSEGSKVEDAYPLTMVVYAMVPTAGISRQKAAKIAQWLDYVATSGQDQGAQAGQLPSGYLPLTTAMREQTLRAASEVLAQKGNSSAKTAKAATTPTPVATVAPTPSASVGAVSLGFDSNPAKSGFARYAIPILLALSALLAVAGSLSFAIGRGGGAALGRLRKLSVPRGLLPRRNRQ